MATTTTTTKVCVFHLLRAYSCAITPHGVVCVCLCVLGRFFGCVLEGEVSSHGIALALVTRGRGKVHVCDVVVSERASMMEEKERRRERNTRSEVSS